MGRQDTSFRIIRKVSAPEEVKSTQSMNQANVPSTHLKLNAPFKTEDPKNEYPFEIENNYELVPNMNFDVSLVSYYDVNDRALFSSYITRWRGPAVIALLYRSNETSLLSSFQSTCASFHRVVCFPFLLENSRVPLNKIKNAGIDRVSTSHFLVAEPNLSPTTNLYDTLLRTPAYLWRDSSFAGVIPVYEWASPFYHEAVSSYRKYGIAVNGPQSLKECLSAYRCRPLQTSTIPMQFRWFTYVNYRAMTCMDKDSEEVFVLQKSARIPRYDEAIEERGFDNVEYTEKIRNANMKLGMLANDFFFRIEGIGVDSYTVRKNQRRPELRKQFELSREEFLKTIPNHHPIATCEEIDNAMRGWLNLKKYKWLNATVEDGVFYPRIAVDAFAKPKQG